jgi:hypothetical protein
MNTKRGHINPEVAFQSTVMRPVVLVVRGARPAELSCPSADNALETLCGGHQAVLNNCKENQSKASLL